MTLENIIESLNKYIIEEREERKIDCKTFLILQKSLVPQPMFKIYKDYTVTIWLLNPENKKKEAIYTYKTIDKFTESNDKNLILANKDICKSIFSLCRQKEFDQVIEGTYGNINE